VLRLGFEYYAYKGLETGSRDVAAWAVKQNDIILVFQSPLNPVESPMAKAIELKGDAAKDVAFDCKDTKGTYEKVIARGGVSVLPPTEEKDDDGKVIRATVKTYGDVVHSFIQRDGYKGHFLPGYIKVEKKDPLSSLVGNPGLKFIDHVVGNQPDLGMLPVVEWYEKVLGFHRFWSVDDSQMHTKYSALRSIVMADPSEKIKMPLNEPAPGMRKSQIQEYIDYHGEPGVQHIALNTPDVLAAVKKNLAARGVEFLKVPKTYYEDLRKRLAISTTKVAESLDEIEKLHILVDFDETGYLLQIFTKPVEDRPTLFYEVIQRAGHQGFGAGNFKSLFEAIERDQAERGNLTSEKSDEQPAKKTKN